MTEKKKLLAIDDDPVFLRTLASYILGSPYELQISKSAMEATAIMTKYKPDLILLDIEMPGISGFEFLHNIRKDPKLMNVPVVIVTGHTETEFLIHAETSGASGVVPKPINKAMLFEKIAKALEHPAKSILDN